MTRIQFIKQTPITLAEVPVEAWGRVQIVHQQPPPVLDGESGQFVMPRAERSHCFPKGAVIELPDDCAQHFIAADQAVVYSGETGEHVENAHDFEPPQNGGQQ